MLYNRRSRKNTDASTRNPLARTTRSTPDAADRCQADRRVLHILAGGSGSDRPMSGRPEPPGLRGPTRLPALPGPLLDTCGIDPRAVIDKRAGQRAYLPATAFAAHPSRRIAE